MKWRACSIANSLEILIAISTISAIILGILLFRPWVHDTTAYHLPFVARQFKIQAYDGISNLLDDRYKGFPIVWRYALAPGLFLGMPRLYILPNLFAAIAFGYCIRKLLGISALTAIAATLCFPISYLGFASAYQDYFTNTLVLAGGLLCANVSFVLVKRQDSSGCFTRLFIGLGFIAIAANTKIQGLLLAVTIIGTVVVYSFLLIRLDIKDRQINHQDHRYSKEGNLSLQLVKSLIGNNDKKIKILVIAVTAVLIFYQPLSNLINFSNPFFPVRTLGFNGPEKQYHTPLEYIPNIPILSNSLSHYLSTLEIDPYVLPITKIVGDDFSPPVWRSIDMFGNRQARTGGSLGLIYGPLFALMLFSSFKLIRSTNLQTFRHSMAVFIPLTSLAISVLPQSLELRYYLIGLFVASIGALISTGNQLLFNTSRMIILIGLLISILHLGRGRGLQSLTFLGNLQSELPSIEQCVSSGRMSLNPSGDQILHLDPAKVSNHFPFQCRMVMPRSVYIDYTKSF